MAINITSDGKKIFLFGTTIAGLIIPREGLSGEWENPVVTKIVETHRGQFEFTIEEAGEHYA